MKFHPDPNYCSCCEGVEPLTPLSIASRPGLPALAYRIGTHATFLETMLARLSSLALEVDDNGAPVPWQGAGATRCKGIPTPTDPCASSSSKQIFPLGGMTTRRPDDPAIALLDAWALVADVLTFYQARIANEGYIRTAVERRSVQELARLAGYKLRPGLAASVYLAFTLDKDFQADIPTGTRVLSVPKGAEISQPFETAEPISARYAWNAIPANQQRPQYIAGGNVDQIERIFVQGLGTQLRPNDPLLFVFGEKPGEQTARFVQRIEPVVVIEPIPGAGYTIVELQSLEGIKDARRIAADLQNPAAFGVNPDTQTARNIVPRLNNIARARSRERLAREVALLLQDAQAPLLNPGVALTGWLNGLKAGFQPLNARLNQQPPAGGALAASDKQFPFLDQAAAQVKEPNLRFANGKELPRSITTLLAPGSETIPSMLTRLKPGLAKTFYVAWGSAQAGSNSDLQQAAALRVKTAPFGHNAGLKSILDERGALIDQKEWPLIGDVLFQVSIPAPVEEDGEVLLEAGIGSRAAILVKAAGKTFKRSILLNGTHQIELPVGEVLADFSDDNRRQFSFQGQNLQREIIFEIDHSTVKIIVDGIEVAQVTPGQIEDILLPGGHTVSASFNAGRVEVTDESLSPPDRLDVLDLEFAYDQILPGSWVLIDRPIWTEPRAFQVLDVQTISLNAYNISGKTTRLELSDKWLTRDDLLLSDIRQTTVYAQSEALTLVDERYDDPVAGAEILLDGLYDGLESGRWIFVTGERTDIPGAQGVVDVELAMIASVRQGVPMVEKADGTGPFPRPESKTLTALVLAQPLDHTYDRKTVKIYANVTKATHGETHREILGSGDARKAFQAFALRASPLTYLPAAIPSGAASTLELRLNNVRWPELDNLLFLNATDRGYELRRDDDGKKDISSVITGDGVHGARPPTGTENVEAIYRSGLGKAGNVAADTLRNLVIRPLGVKFVTNPQPASGGADRDDRDSARRNAPLAVMALDRLVSVQDYEDFARMFAGVAKATAAVFPQARGKLVHVTLAGAGNIPIDRNSDLLRMLNEAMRRYGDPSQPFEIDVRELLLLMISAGVRLTGEIPWATVAEQIRLKLKATFGFERRELGQDVYTSEIEAVIEQVPGVDFVDVDFLDALSEEEALDEQRLLARLPGGQLPPRPKKGIDVQYARPGSEFDILPAQLAILSPDIDDTLILTELP
jgi:predicted phage baseplate assembly protein